jgi:flagellar FliL protein
MSDIRGYEGQNLLKEELISRINAILETGNVINIYFTEFIVQ